jgi:hypothetical protein
MPTLALIVHLIDGVDAGTRGQLEVQVDAGGQTRRSRNAQPLRHGLAAAPSRKRAGKSRTPLAQATVQVASGPNQVAPGRRLACLGFCSWIVVSIRPAAHRPPTVLAIRDGGRRVVLRPGSAAADEVDDQRDDRHDQEQVNQATRDVKRSPTEQPGRHQHDEQNHKHDTLLFSRVRRVPEPQRQPSEIPQAVILTTTPVIL